MASAAERSSALKKAAMLYFVKKRYAVEHELGLDKRGKFRADVFAMTIYGYLCIVEIKQSVADYRQDKKWRSYFNYANKVYFGFLPDTWAKVKEGFPTDVGVMVLSEQTGRMRVVQRAKHNELPPGNKKMLVMRMAYRGAAFSRRTIKRILPVFLPKEKS